MRWTGTGAAFRFPQVSGRRIEVEFSADMATWRPALGQMTWPGDGTVEWQEEEPTTPPVAPPARFYRLTSRE
jgi:hypothetical protein